MLTRALCLAALVLTVPAGIARGAPGLLVGVTEDGLKFEPDAALADARKLGIDAFRITLRWRPGLTSPTATQAAELDRATSGPANVSIVLSVFGERAIYAPSSAARQEDYCAFLAEIARRWERIRYIAVWNEPNKTFFWTPQFNPDGSSAAPVAYEQLLARCWDALHEARADIKLIAPTTAPRGNDKPEAVSNVSHSPTLFVRELGRAYRESGRDSPIFDIVGHHVHAVHSAERPWRPHPGSGVTQGDLEKLEQAFSQAFAGTAQPVPGRCIEKRCVPVWWLEAGFQTQPDEKKAELYKGVEISPRPLPDAVGDVELDPLPESSSLAPDQATQIISGLRLAYCQPHVEAFFNFLLWDEQRLEGWQSAPYWFDRTPKGSFAAFRSAIREVNRGEVDCDAFVAASRHEAQETSTATTTASPPAPNPPAPGSPAAGNPAAGSPPEAEGGGGDRLPGLLAAAAATLLVAGSLAYVLRRRSARRVSR